MKSMAGLHKAVAGFRKRERECLDGTLRCTLRGCERPSAGYVAAWNGAMPICREHIPQAERLGYSVTVGAEPEPLSLNSEGDA